MTTADILFVLALLLAVFCAYALLGWQREHDQRIWYEQRWQFANHRVEAMRTKLDQQREMMAEATATITRLSVILRVQRMTVIPAQPRDRMYVN